MQQPERIAELILNALEVFMWIVLAWMHRRTRTAVGVDVSERVSAVGLQLQRVIASSLRPPALTCSECAHPQQAHAPQFDPLQRLHDRRLRLTGDHAGPCTAKHCSCPGWSQPAELAFEDDPTPTTREEEG